MEEITEQKNFKARASAFFDHNYPLFFAPIIVLVAFTVALISYGVYPFGDKYTLASYDLSAQICPFIEHLFDVLQGKSSLSYSYAIAGGADVVGTFLYFFISPFSFLFLIFGDGMVAHASSIVMGLKVAAISVSGTWFAQKLFKGIPDYICIVIGIVYAYCGYTFVSCTYINWMDFLIYLPFCAAAFVRFVRTGKFLPFSILVACCIYTCFSIACFSMLIAFPTLIFYGLLCVEREKRNRFLADLCLSFVVAVLIALPVLLPALFAYMRSGRGGGGLFENLWFGFTVLSDDTLGSFNSSRFLNDWSLALYRKWSYVLSDSVFVILTLVWFCRRGLKDKFAQFMLVAGVFTLLPLIVDEAMLLMNMGSYMSYALRFGFLNALYFLGGACLAIEGLCFDENRAYDGGLLHGEEMLNDGGRYKITAWKIVIVALGVAASAFLVWFISAENYKNIWNGLTSDSEMLEAFQSVSARYAHSLGGLEVIVVPFVLVVIVAGVGCAFVHTKRVSPRLVSYVLLVVVGVQVLFYNNQLVLGNRSTQHVALGSYQSLCTTLNESDDSYFRVKDYDDKLTATAPFTGNSHSFSVFSSVIDKDNFVIYNLFGYKGNGKNSLKSAHTNKSHRCEEFGDSFLGYKYYFVPEEKKEDILTDHKLKKYVKPLMEKDENGTETKQQLCKDGFYVFENEIVFPSAYKVSSGELRFAKPNDENPTNRKYNQQTLYQFLRGKTLSETRYQTGSSSSELVTPESARELSEYLWGKAAKIEVGAGTIKASVQAEAGEYLFLNFVASKGYQVTVNGKAAELIDNDLKFLLVKLEAGENVVEFTYRSPYINYTLIGACAAVIGLLAVAVIVKKTGFVAYLSPVIAWAGILLSAAVIAFFMLFPSVVWIVKLIKFLL